MKIALISDIHFGKDSATKEFSVPGEEVFDETTGAVSLEQGLIDVLKDNEAEYLFIAGDLTSVGSPQEYFYCEKKILEIAEKSNIPKENIICSLGNHDIDWHISDLVEKQCENKSLPDGVVKIIKDGYKKLSAFTPYINLNDLGRYNEEVDLPNVYVKEASDFIVFVLNTSWDCNPDQEITSHGKLSTVQIEWFEKTAQRYIDDNRYKIVLMHHHPYQYAYAFPYFDCSMIEDGSEFLTAAAKNKINLVLHGHRHHPTTKTIMEGRWSAPITFLCAGSLSVNYMQRSGSPNTVHIIDIKCGEKVIDLYNYEYSLSEGWKPLYKYSNEKPLDYKMHLGKIIGDKELDALVEGCIKQKRNWEWDELPEDIRFRPFEDVNNSFRKFVGDSMVGEFPKRVYIISEEEVNK